MKSTAERTIPSYFLRDTIQTNEHRPKKVVGNCMCINVQFKETHQHYLWENMQVLLHQKNNERVKPLTYNWFYMYRPSEKCLAVNGLWNVNLENRTTTTTF